MGRPDLLVVDLDGTLLGADGGVSAENRDAIDRARREGLAVVVATGRAHSECLEILHALDYSGPLISASGSLLVEVPSGRTLDRRTIGVDVTRRAVEMVLSHGAVPLVLKDRHVAGMDYLIVGDTPLHPVSDWWFGQNEAVCVRVERIEDDPAPDDTVRIGGVGTPDEFDALVTELDEEFGSTVTVRHWPAVTSSHQAGTPIHLLEVFAPTADKWTMLESHCRLIGLEPDRTCAVGDGLNDVLIIERCGLGVAVANADHRVLAVADMITDAHHEHGVARLVHDLLDGRLRLAPR